MNERQTSLFAERNTKADRAYDRALAPARLALRNPDRVPYPVAAVSALAAYDAVDRGVPAANLAGLRLTKNSDRRDAHRCRRSAPDRRSRSARRLTKQPDRSR